MPEEEPSSLPRFTPRSGNEAAGSCTVGTEAVVSCVDPVAVTVAVPDPDPDDPDAAPDPAPDPDGDPDTGSDEADAADAAEAAGCTPTGADSDAGRAFCSLQQCS